MPSDFGSLGEPIEVTEKRVRLAARALARHGLVHAYGHVSARLDQKRFLVCAAKPMGTIKENENGSVVEINKPLPKGVLGEVRCHQTIYATRPGINGICRIFPRNVMTLSTFRLTPKARLGFGAYFFPQPPLWDDPLLIRDDLQAKKFAEKLGNAKAIVMRGNGAICVAPTIEESVVLGFYLEESANTELAVLANSTKVESTVFTHEQAMVRATGSGRIYERMWDYLTDNDPEK
ncbi:MAG: class II aldolase [Rhodospirillaceae bacterium]|nr:class II aldolase [Rhodospirillaceae bacterium]|tara:strand:+ start:9241 stop:9942 length:702 start_codon:yes stop_codon:yes gene_type:complete